jgi:soluble lytic murein transglycosylase-like protein
MPCIAVCAVALLLSGADGAASAAERPTAYDEMIARHAAAHGVPAAFVHRVIMRESRYNPRSVHRHCYGLLQIKYATARSMGYKGGPKGLLDPEINLTYAVPYLSNAFNIAGGNEERAIVLFSSGYYFTAKRQNQLSELRTASMPALAAQSAAAKLPEGYP